MEDRNTGMLTPLAIRVHPCPVGRGRTEEQREPLAGLTLAADCIEVIYAAYLSAEEGRRVTLELS